MDCVLYVQISESLLAGIVIVGTCAMLLCFASIWLLAVLYERKRLLFEEKAKRQASEYETRLQIERTEEAERIIREVAGTIHDHVGNKLAFLVTILRDLRNLCRRDIPLNSDDLQRARNLAAEVMGDIRGLNRIIEGKSLLEKGLLYAIQTSVADMKYIEGVTVNLHTGDTVPFDAFDTNTLLHILRVFQESASNAIKHAQARTLNLSITAAGSSVFQMDVVDDGCGFDPTTLDDSASLGLSNMRFRADAIGGRLIIDSKPGAGTRVRLLVPTSEIP